MTLQDVFYIVGLVYMTLGIILLLALVIAVFYIKKKVEDMHKTFEQKLDLVHKIVQRPAESAMDIGATVAEAAIEKIKSAWEGKKKAPK